jgi:NADP-dependent 3-hydroxy acid dehydrogenase YdfG
VKAAEAAPRQVADLVNISSTAGRSARAGASGYNATKFGVVALTEALRQELSLQHVRVSVVEPGAVDTELRLHNRPEIQQVMAQRFGDIEVLRSEDIAETVTFIVTRPRHVAINELLIRPTEQTL